MRESDRSRQLTERELRVVQLVAEGLTNQELAQKLDRSEHVIKNWLRVIYDKVGMWTRLELALWWVKREYESSTAMGGSRREILGQSPEE